MDIRSDSASAKDPAENQRYWWVNHKGTHGQELAGEFLWTPKKKSGDGESSNNMTRIMPGDVVFAYSCVEGTLRAVGVAVSRARELPNPFESGIARRHAGSHRGWQVGVSFAELGEPLRPKSHATELSRVLPEKHAPLRPGGEPNPSLYLASVPQRMAATLRRLIGRQLDDLLEEITQRAGASFPDDVAEEAILQRTDLGPAAKTALLRARRGQGVYRQILERIEPACRLTGLLDRRHLRAIHIKPWRVSSDAEKLDGNNGLLLSPHLEHLFGRGYISFSDSGELLVSQYLNPAVLEKWGLQLPRYVEPFRPEQCRYLDYHRREVYENHMGGRRKVPAMTVEDPVEPGPGAPVTVYGTD